MPVQDDIVFIKVRSALGHPGCPICWLAGRAAQRFLWGFLYEHVNDPFTREELLASRGFCGHHAWMLAPSYDRLGIAIVYRHLLQEYAGELEGVAGSPTGGRSRRSLRELSARIASRLRPKRLCPACEVVRQTENSALTGLLRRLDDVEIYERLASDAALCRPHFLRAVDLADHPEQIRRLTAALLTRLRDLIGHLDEFIRKHDYRFSQESMTEEEAVAWMRALETVVGRDWLQDRKPLSSGK